ncbi:ribonuclease III [Sulfurimonas sp. HSL3-7]|uniref:ribonuclease III n=1 Tax=Sulfonitrofixus jiaomeiensis TaxID=3131938 RepID=UPI0031F7D8C2
MEQIKALEDRLGYSFKNKKLIIEALTHKSYKQPYNNERLEFLGDAVLDLIVGEYLFENFPNHDEGKLSKMRASLVNEEGFTRLANHIGLGKQLLLSNAEENNGGRSKPSLLSNAFEAIIGALYLEAGLEKARDISIKLLEEVYPDISLDTLFKDYKTTLQEMTQAQFGTTPEYKLVGSHGPDHKKEFEIAVHVDGKEYARASGKSKKIAQQEAAFLAINILKENEK